jgi:hypothetical protein
MIHIYIDTYIHIYIFTHRTLLLFIGLYYLGIYFQI